MKSEYEDYLGWKLRCSYMPKYECYSANGYKQYGHDSRGTFTAQGVSESDAIRILCQWIDLVESALTPDREHDDYDDWLKAIDGT